MKLQNSFRDYTAESALFVRRALVAFLGILLLTGVLIANLYNLQIVRFTDYQTRSNENRIKLVPIAPSRGIIYDRNGIPLALNRTIYQIEMMPEKVDNVQQTLDALRSVVDLTDDDIAAFRKERARSHRFTSIPVKTNLTEVQVARFAVNQYRFPGVEVKGYKRRYYPYGSALTHVIGYVSKINDKDVERLNNDGKLANYAATHDIGKLGIERYYEDVLHGQTGYEEVEVNNRGRVIRQLKEVPPQAGHDIYLTLDLKLQQYIETLLAGSRAAVVVTDPRTGGVLALVSTPSYDPNSEKRYRDWKKWGHGRLNVTRSLEESADTFFYQVAYDMGIDRLSEWMGKFGYGHYTGIDLAEERSGNMPTREWKQKRFKKPWYQGDTIPVGIGQGYWTATPIQMSKALMILINDGIVKVPHLLMSTAEDGKQVPWVQPHEPPVGDIHSGYWELAKDGMYGVANRPNGTAHKYFASAPYKIAAKSGTAQVFGLKANETYNAHKIAERLRDHKLMTAFAPYNNPQVAVAMILENGGAGPAVGTLMRQILDHIMLGDNNTDLPAENPAVAAAEDH